MIHSTHPSTCRSHTHTTSTIFFALFSLANVIVNKPSYVSIYKNTKIFICSISSIYIPISILTYTYCSGCCQLFSLIYLIWFFVFFLFIFYFISMEFSKRQKKTQIENFIKINFVADCETDGKDFWCTIFANIRPTTIIPICR